MVSICPSQIVSKETARRWLENQRFTAFMVPAGRFMYNMRSSQIWQKKNFAGEG